MTKTCMTNSGYIAIPFICHFRYHFVMRNRWDNIDWSQILFLRTELPMELAMNKYNKNNYHDANLCTACLVTEILARFLSYGWDSSPLWTGSTVHLIYILVTSQISWVIFYSVCYNSNSVVGQNSIVYISFI